ncbi:histidinol dehydrogenase [Jannaschia pohangensis]|uniref:Histidinol dehydrogenase homolog n=1 Tax=Jannaschia pohangensis TaxID=390807 RepID=A0A1I3IID7_9RHOB|nr:histidinol dehydrogenase [Jannaschia pohangensis]SFI47597.1 sulfopropanediol 3-dehydrogenase [Jannaschia pohangensis]
MATYLKKATQTAETAAADVSQTVSAMLAEIEAGGDAAALAWSEKLDGTTGHPVLTRAQIDAASAQLSDETRRDIAFARDNVRRFAEAQRATLSQMELEVVPGLVAGQKVIPVSAAGAYVPGGRYAHVASAIMTVTTAKVAGVSHITVASPPRKGGGIDPAIAYAADICGADTILAMGGVQGIAAMTFGLFDTPEAAVLVGPGNQFVAEAKRLLFGRVGIDMVAGPTDSLILADGTADAEVVAVDLVSQAEHGWNSPVWLVTDDEALARAVMDRMDALIADLPSPNRESAEAAWRDFGEVILCDDREEMAAISDSYAPEHLTVQANDLGWWLERLTCYGSLFLGEEVTVTYGDKASGTNHVLPTSGAARYTGGLSVHKFLKIVTWQRATRDGARPVAEASARISRIEGMEGHARAADVRLRKYGQM